MGGMACDACRRTVDEAPIGSVKYEEYLGDWSGDRAGGIYSYLCPGCWKKAEGFIDNMEPPSREAAQETTRPYRARRPAGRGRRGFGSGGNGGRRTVAGAPCGGCGHPRGGREKPPGCTSLTPCRTSGRFCTRYGASAP